MDKLLTKKDLAIRWQVSEKTIDQYRNSGVIVPIKGLPCIRFNLQYIEKIEGRIPERTTLRERRLEIELEYWKTRALKAERAISNANVIFSEVLYNTSKDKE